MLYKDLLLINVYWILGKTSFAPNLEYVGLSRCRRLKGMIIQSYPFSRWKPTKTMTARIFERLATEKKIKESIVFD